MTAIIGPSGSGKTTLMNVLAGRNYSSNLFQTGKLSVNGTEIKSMNPLKNIIGYVTQEDILIETNTVRQNMMTHAVLRNVPDRKNLVQGIINKLQLTKCQDTQVGGAMVRGVSGGEKKRVSIGVELVSSPSVLFMDEPTTGLDSNTAFEIMKLMRDIKNSDDMTVVAVMHAPSNEIMALFDSLIILCDGLIIFHGPPEFLGDRLGEIELTVPRFSNPVEHFLQGVDKDGIKIELETQQMQSMENSQEYFESIKNLDKKKLQEMQTKFDLELLEKVDKLYEERFRKLLYFQVKYGPRPIRKKVEAVEQDNNQKDQNVDNEDRIMGPTPSKFDFDEEEMDEFAAEKQADPLSGIHKDVENEPIRVIDEDTKHKNDIINKNNNDDQEGVTNYTEYETHTKPQKTVTYDQILKYSKKRNQMRNFFVQVAYLTGQNTRTYFKNIIIVIFLIAGICIINGMMFAVYNDLGDPSVDTVAAIINRMGFMFMFTAFAAFMGLNSTVGNLIPKKKIFNKERQAKLYSYGSFYLSLQFYDIFPMIPVYALLTLLYYLGIPLNQDQGVENFFYFYFFSIVGGFLTGNSLGFMIGSIATSAEQVSALIPITILPFMLVNGFFANLKTVNPFLLGFSYLSPIRFAFQGACLTEFRNSQTYIDNCHVHVKINGENVLQAASSPKCDPLLLADFYEDKIWMNVMIILIQLVAYRIIGFIFFRVLNRERVIVSKDNPELKAEIKKNYSPTLMQNSEN